MSEFLENILSDFSFFNNFIKDFKLQSLPVLDNELIALEIEGFFNYNMPSKQKIEFIPRSFSKENRLYEFGVNYHTTTETGYSLKAVLFEYDHEKKQAKVGLIKYQSLKENKIEIIYNEYTDHITGAIYLSVEKPHGMSWFGYNYNYKTQELEIESDLDFTNFKTIRKNHIDTTTENEKLLETIFKLRTQTTEEIETERMLYDYCISDFDFCEKIIKAEELMINKNLTKK